MIPHRINIPKYFLGVILFTCLLSLFLVQTVHAQWVLTNGPKGNEVSSFSVIPNGAGGTILFAGTAGDGVFRSTDDGTTWAAASTGLTNDHVYALSFSDTNLFAGTWGGGVFLSTNLGTSWTAVDSGLTNTYVLAIAVSPDGAGGADVFAGTADDGVYLSTDNGTTWNVTGLAYTTINALAVSPNGAGGTNLLAGTDRGVFLSSDNGTTWNVTAPTHTIVHALAVSPNGAGGTNLIAGTDGGVLISTDNGTHWNISGLRYKVVQSLAVGSNGIGGTILFAGVLPDGVYYSIDNGATWLGMGLNLVFSLILCSDGAGGISLFAGTDDGGIWRLNLSGMFTSIPHIQQVSSDSLLVADSIQLTDSSRWSLGGSPQYSRTVFLPARCVVPPLILTKTRYAMVVYDTSATSPFWGGIVVECGLYGPLYQFLDVKEGDNIFMVAQVEEVPSLNLNSETRLNCLSLVKISSLNNKIAPITVSMSDFYEGSYPSGKIKYSSGEQYEGMLVELHHLRSSSIIDTLNGTFMLIDSAGNTFSAADLSKWFTLGSYRDSSSTYSIPVNAFIDTIRGIITSVDGSPNPNGGYGYCIAPVYPGDIVYGGSSRSRISGTVFYDENKDSVRNTGESGLGGWRVILSGKSQSATITDNEGRYLFTGIDSGRYTVLIHPPPGSDITVPQAGSYTVNLGINDTISGKDFGYHYRWNQILGSVYEDRNNNGVRDDFEKGFSHWLVRMTGAINDSAFTDSLGNYSFTLLGHTDVTINIVAQSPWEQIWPRFNSGYDMFFTQDTMGVAHLDFAMEKIPVRIKLAITVRDNTITDMRVLSWGNRPGATFGIWSVDPACTRFDFAEQELPVPPLVNGYFDARFINPNLTSDQFEYGSWTDMRGFSSPAQVDTHAVMFEPGLVSGGDYPMRFYWSKEEVQRSFSGPVTMQTPSGAITDMKMTDSLILIDSRIWYLYIITKGPNIPPQYTQQWRIVSLPVQSQAKKVLDLFPTSLTQAFSYLALSGYSMNNSMVPGVGYWLRMIYAIDSGQVQGMPIMQDTIAVTSGWNLVGGIGVSLAVSDLESVPEGILSNHIFGYGDGYYITDSLRPYNGYWVKAGEDGRVVFKTNNSPLSGKNAAMLGTSADVDKMNIITLTDDYGSCRKLYFATADSQQTMDKEMFELPPLPPDGIYDVRYGTNRMVEVVTSGSTREVPVRISSASYPVTVAWEMKEQSMAASLLIGKTDRVLKGKGEIKISSSDEDVKLKISGSLELPKEYKLYQNYPNPFNPETHIVYTLPHGGYVHLNIYNILGQLVARVVDEKEEAGRYDAIWNAAPFTSGVYFYRLEAGSFRQTKKMLLMR
jgi:hypothetical protein